MKSATLKPKLSLATLTPICLMLAINVSGCNPEDRKKPDWQEMRSFRISKMTDQQIRDLRAKAETQYQQDVEDQKEMATRFWKEWSALQLKCTDVVFQSRNKAECEQPLPLDSATMGQLPSYHQTAEEMFETSVMGPCDVAETVSRAREWGCLPKRP